MAKNVVEVSHAVAEAVKLCEPDVTPIYPITPQTHVSEKLSQMIADGDLRAEKINVESEQSAISACIGAQATGLRAYTATSGQGLALMHEILFIASGMRLPIVMTVANRSLSAPLSIWNDQQDSIASRDCGWVQLYVENAQEAYDTHIQAFRIAEETHNPVMVCMDGFVVSHTYENIEFEGDAKVKSFLPKYKPLFALDPEKPLTMGALGTPHYFVQFRKQQQETLEGSLPVITRVNNEFARKFKRKYGDGLIEKIGMERKKHALVTIGSVTGTARELASEMGIGIIKVKSFRPFPAEALRQACSGLESVGVVEKDISIGAAGALYDEVRSALYPLEKRPNVSGHIAGIGGRDITLNDMKDVISNVKSGSEKVDWIM